MEIEKFVPQEDITAVYFDKVYYITPDGDAGLEAFVVIREAMEKAGMFAISRVVLARKAEKRIDLVRAGAQLAAAQLVLGMALGAFSGAGALGAALSGFWSGLNGFFCGVLALGFLLLLIVPSFVFFGVQGYSRFTEAGNEEVARVDRVSITRAEWDAAVLRYRY